MREHLILGALAGAWIAVGLGLTWLGIVICLFFGAVAGLALAVAANEHKRRMEWVRQDEENRERRAGLPL
jgi:uncharacterized membrane protein